MPKDKSEELIEEIENPFLERLEAELETEKTKNTQLYNELSNFSQGGTQDPNLVQWQLDTDDILDRIEHFMKGEIIKEDAEGNVDYIKPETDDLAILNSYGVNSVMQILGNYVNRIHMLSFYSDERVNEILADLGDELALFIFCNYEKMGMTTEFKKSRYAMLVINILHIIESCYRRALFGKEREEANTGRLITETNRYPGGNIPSALVSQKKKRFGIFG